MSTDEFRILMNRLDRIEAKIQSDTSKWISEATVMALTGLGKDSLRKKRKANVFRWSTATGRKIKYLRKNVEDYLNDNSTL